MTEILGWILGWILAVEFFLICAGWWIGLVGGWQEGGG